MPQARGAQPPAKSSAAGQVGAAANASSQAKRACAHLSPKCPGPGPSGLLCWPAGWLPPAHSGDPGPCVLGGGSAALGAHASPSGGKGRQSRNRGSWRPAALPGHLTSRQRGEHTQGPCAGGRMQTPGAWGERDTYRLMLSSTYGAWPLFTPGGSPRPGAQVTHVELG